MGKKVKSREKVDKKFSKEENKDLKEIDGRKKSLEKECPKG